MTKMSKQRVSLGEYTITEMRLKPDGAPDVFVLTDDDVTNAFRTHQWFSHTIDLANVVLHGRRVKVLLEFSDRGLNDD